MGNKDYKTLGVGELDLEQENWIQSERTREDSGAQVEENMFIKKKEGENIVGSRKMFKVGEWEDSGLWKTF